MENQKSEKIEPVLGGNNCLAHQRRDTISICEFRSCFEIADRIIRETEVGDDGEITSEVKNFSRVYLRKFNFLRGPPKMKFCLVETYRFMILLASSANEMMYSDQ